MIAARAHTKYTWTHHLFGMHMVVSVCQWKFYAQIIIVFGWANSSIKYYKTIIFLKNRSFSVSFVFWMRKKGRHTEQIYNQIGSENTSGVCLVASLWPINLRRGVIKKPNSSSQRWRLFKIAWTKPPVLLQYKLRLITPLRSFRNKTPWCGKMFCINKSL